MGSPMEPGGGVALHGLQRVFSVANVGSRPQAAAETCPHQTLLEALGCPPPSSYLQEEAVQATPACWDPAPRAVLPMLLPPAGS